jgi:hypothetical protein
LAQSYVCEWSFAEACRPIRPLSQYQSNSRREIKLVAIRTSKTEAPISQCGRADEGIRRPIVLDDPAVPSAQPEALQLKRAPPQITPVRQQIQQFGQKEDCMPQDSARSCDPGARRRNAPVTKKNFHPSSA